MKAIVSSLVGMSFTLVVLAGIECFAGKAVIANAESKPAALEKMGGKHGAGRHARERNSKELKNPIQSSDENLVAGLQLYAETERNHPPWCRLSNACGRPESPHPPRARTVLTASLRETENIRKK